MSKEKILLLGSDGFLGSAISNALNFESTSVLRVCTSSRSRAAGEGVDLRDVERIVEMAVSSEPSDIVIAAAAGVTRGSDNLTDLCNVNAFSVDKILERLKSARLKPKISIFGTAYEYRSLGAPMSENAPLAPQSDYAISKTLLYHIASKHASSFVINHFRLFNVLGVGEPKSRLLPFVYEKIKNRERCDLTEGRQIRDFISVCDVAEIVLRVIKLNEGKYPGIATFNIGTSVPTKVRTLVELFVDQLIRLGYESTVVFGAIPMRANDPLHCICDNSLIKEVIGQYEFRDVKSIVDEIAQKLHHESQNARN